MDGPQLTNALQSTVVDTPADVIAIQEAALRQLALADPDFEIFVMPLHQACQLWWRIVVQFPGYTRHLRLVDGRLRDRRWKQLNALARFVCRSCGSERRMTVKLDGVDPDCLLTKGD